MSPKRKRDSDLRGGLRRVGDFMSAVHFSGRSHSAQRVAFATAVCSARGRSTTVWDWIVYPRPAALRWLAKAKELASTLPILKDSRRRAQKELRALLGWPRWTKDCTRHSAASYWLAAEESAAKVAMQLGHGEGILSSHYMALVTTEEAAAYWQL